VLAHPVEHGRHHAALQLALHAQQVVCTHFGAWDPTQEEGMFAAVQRLWFDDSGQDIAEYAVMLAVILVLVVGTVRLIGSNANTAFSEVASSVQ